MIGAPTVPSRASILRRLARKAVLLNECFALDRLALLTEPLLREAFRSDRSGTLLQWADWLRNNGQSGEAEPLFRGSASPL